LIRVLDTNVLLDRSIQEVIQSFEPCHIVIPLAVVQELDNFKSYEDNRGRNAREAIRFMDGLRKHGKLYEGVPTEYGSVVKVEVNCSDVELPDYLNRSLPDTRILMVAKGLSTHNEDVTLVTQDICERVIADVLDIKAEDYSVDSIDLKKIYSGWTEINITNDEIQEFYQSGTIKTRKKLIPNQYVIMNDEIGGVHYGRYDVSQKCIRKINSHYDAWGVRPVKNNIQQRFLMDLLLDDSVKLVTALGPSGCGKTLLALAAGLQKTINERKYRKLIVTRAIIPIGNDIGFLPGNKEEKLTPWMGAIFDNLEFLTEGMEVEKYSRGDPTPAERVEELLALGFLELEALTFIRGRSIPNQWIILDEGQNLTKDQMKTIISRAGEGTKIIITGDIEQVDNHRLNSSNNGLVHVIESFKGQDIYGHITLTKTERSKLSELAVQLL
jgi:PhoH-like ATPase